jgi:hypothetical protein
MSFPALPLPRMAWQAVTLESTGGRDGNPSVAWFLMTLSFFNKCRFLMQCAIGQNPHLCIMLILVMPLELNKRRTGGQLLLCYQIVVHCNKMFVQRDLFFGVCQIL